MGKKLECKKEFQPGVQKHDVVDFIIHLQVKAERAINQDRESGIENKRRELFLTNDLKYEIENIAGYVTLLQKSQQIINPVIDENQKALKKTWYPRLSLVNVSGPAKDQTMYEVIESEVLRHFNSPELEKYKASWAEKKAQTERAYKVILKNVRATRSLAKMSEYLLSMGFDISKIKPREHEKAEKQPAPKFSKDVLFPCVKD